MRSCSSCRRCSTWRVLGDKPPGPVERARGRLVSRDHEVRNLVEEFAFVMPACVSGFLNSISSCVKSKCRLPCLRGAGRMICCTTVAELAELVGEARIPPSSRGNIMTGCRSGSLTSRPRSSLKIECSTTSSASSLIGLPSDERLAARGGSRPTSSNASFNSWITRANRSIILAVEPAGSCAAWPGPEFTLAGDRRPSRAAAATRSSPHALGVIGGWFVTITRLTSSG